MRIMVELINKLCRAIQKEFMSNITPIKPCADIVQGLINIADSIEAGDIDNSNCTLIIGTNVYHLGTVCDEQSAIEAVFNMTVGIHKLMSPIFIDYD